ncbi:MAG: type II toxin-antitoxin system RelE/ParE family toxin [Patescibacteria group bacterium]|nr:type II toxin-antitoxin system RelE/ParE family toxin [Patescibacteria group bacterium]
MKKIVGINPVATKELNSFPTEVRARFNDLFEILSNEGKLEMPFAKKINDKVFEIRIKDQGQWRAIYAYIMKNQIIILSAFRKKTQKTPKKELTKAFKRLKKY